MTVKYIVAPTIAQVAHSEYMTPYWNTWIHHCTAGPEERVLAVRILLDVERQHEWAEKEVAVAVQEDIQLVCL